jgi:hypothetical protein
VTISMFSDIPSLTFQLTYLELYPQGWITGLLPINPAFSLSHFATKIVSSPLTPADVTGRECFACYTILEYEGIPPTTTHLGSYSTLSVTRLSTLCTVSICSVALRSGDKSPHHSAALRSPFFRNSTRREGDHFTVN